MGVLFTIRRRSEQGVAGGSEQSSVEVNWLMALVIPVILLLAKGVVDAGVDYAKRLNTMEIECHKHMIANPGAPPPVCR
ncbi:hypothetical protein ACI6QG_06915 [Roseococcus sp. DSY-14]|uniref:hypothetical protein n=1 Tax=Roseococcus sp. DSY-14 TaxID=3369650 RepID=UPI00387AC361